MAAWAIGAFALASAAALALAAGPAAAAPAVTFNSPTQGATYPDSSAPPALDFTNNVTAVAQSCRWDGEPFIDCGSSGFSTLRLANGAHSYSVRTLDDTGATTIDVVGFTIYDVSAPTGSVSAVGGPTVTDRLRFDVSIADGRPRVWGALGGDGPELISDGATDFTWTPRHASNGAGTATVTAVDGAGNASTFAPAYTLADGTAPNVTIASPADGSTLPTGDLSTSFSADDDAAAFRCRIDTLAPQPCSPAESARYSNLSPGAHTFSVTATDSAANTGGATAAFTVSDAPGPGLAIDEPTDGATYTAQPLLKLNAASPLQPFSLRCSVNGGPFEYCGDGEPIAGVTGNGSWTVRARAIDSGGGQVAATAAFNVLDHSGPQIDAAPPGAPVSDVSALDLGLSISDQYADTSPTDVPRADCALDGGAAVDCAELLLGSSAVFTPDPHTLAVTAYDWAGNASSASIPFTVDDTAPPTVAIDSPANGATLADGNATVDYSVSEASAQVSCQIDAMPATDCASDPDSTAGSWRLRDLTAGSHSFTVIASDRAGNWSSAAVSVTVTDATGPAMAFVAPADGATLSDRVSLHFISAEPLFRLRCAVGSTALLAEDAPSCDTVAGDRTTGFFAPRSLAGGSTTFYVEGADAQGNVTVISCTLTIADTTPPDLRIDGFDGGSGELTNAAPASVAFSSTDPGANFECAFDGAALATCGGLGSGTLDVPVLLNGSHSLAVRAIDPAGNHTDKSVTFDVTDTVAPRIFVDDAYNGMAAGATLTVHPRAEDAATLTCAVDSGIFSDCSGGAFSATFASGGAHVLRFRATDDNANTANRTITVVATLPPGGAPPPGGTAPPPAPSLAIGALKAKRAGAKLAVRVAVAVTLPAGVPQATACAGTATLGLTVGKKRLQIVVAALRTAAGRCAIAALLKVKTRALAGKKFSVRADFAGNALLGAATASRSGKAPRLR